MLFGKLNRDCRAAHLMLVDSERAVARLREELAGLESECAVLRHEAFDVQAACDAALGMDGAMQRSYGTTCATGRRSRAAADVREREAAMKIAHSLEAISGDTSQTEQNVRHLAECAVQIGSIVQLIKEISEQSDLPALNAAIEATRACGFAVVADEVRKLAGQAAGETSDIVSAIQDETGHTQAQMHDWAARSHVLSGDVGHVTENMKHLLDLAHTVEAALASAETRSFIEAIKISHILYKFEIYKACLSIAHRSPAASLPCKGKGAGPEFFSRLDACPAVAHPHEAFHSHGKDAVTAFQAGEPLRGMEFVARMEAESRAVLNALERMAASGNVDKKLLCHAEH